MSARVSQYEVMLLILALLLLLVPGEGVAQERGQTLPAERRSLVSLDIGLFSGAATYARQIGAGHYLGVGVGGGLERLDVTLVPDTGDDLYHTFDQYLHLSAFYRRRPSRRWEIESGLRAGISTLRSCYVSDCWPGTFVGAYSGVFWGGERFKLGHRILAVINRESGSGARDFVLHTELLGVRITF